MIGGDDQCFDERSAIDRLGIDADLVSTADGTLKLTVERGEQALPALLRVLDAADVTLESINLSRPTLDDVFLTLTGRSLRDAPVNHAAGPGASGAPADATAKEQPA